MKRKKYLKDKSTLDQKSVAIEAQKHGYEFVKKKYKDYGVHTDNIAKWKRKFGLGVRDQKKSVVNKVIKETRVKDELPVENPSLKSSGHMEPIMIKFYLDTIKDIIDMMYKKLQ